jgi:hypothetical protein
VTGLSVIEIRRLLPAPMAPRARILDIGHPPFPGGRIAAAVAVGTLPNLWRAGYQESLSSLNRRLSRR